MRRLVGPGLAVLVACAFAAPVASADDASLRERVKTEERQARPALRAFVQAAEGLRRNDRSIARLRRATTGMVRALDRYARAVGGETASSPAGEKAKTALMKALEGMAGGLRTFRTALAKLQEGDDGQEVKRTMNSALRRIRRAQRDLRGAQALMPAEGASA